jgi:hypothetical protein
VQVLYQRCAGIDVGKDVIAVAVRRPDDGPGGRVTVRRTYRAFYGVLAEMARWLVPEDVTHMAMEGTGIYSMPVYHALVEHGDLERVLVCNAGHVKNVPGRKTDLAATEWVSQLLECGLVTGQVLDDPLHELRVRHDLGQPGREAHRDRPRPSVVDRTHDDVPERGRPGNTDSLPAWSLLISSRLAVTRASRSRDLSAAASSSLRSSAPSWTSAKRRPLTPAFAATSGLRRS